MNDCTLLIVFVVKLLPSRSLETKCPSFTARKPNTVGLIPVALRYAST